MYCTPCARLMKSITPNTSVSPAATRNSRMPSCAPLNSWTRNREVDIRLSPLPNGRWRRQSSTPGPPRGMQPCCGQRQCAAGLLQGAVGSVAVGGIAEHFLNDLRLKFAVGAFGDLDQVEVLHGKTIVGEREAAAHRLEIRLLQRGPQRLLVGQFAGHRLHGAADQLRGI